MNEAERRVEGAAAVTRRFRESDQRAFAQVSGDRNPVHLDPVLARRLLTGGPVVHGVHALLWALDEWSARSRRGPALRSLTVQFRRPIPVDDPLRFRVVRETDDLLLLAVEEGGRLAMRIRAGLGPGHAPAFDVPAARPDVGPPRLRRPEGVESVHGDLPLLLDPDLAGRLFPRALDRLGAQFVALLLASSRLVGMECPGLHSIYAELELTLDEPEGEARPWLHYEVLSYDPRFSRLETAVSAGGTHGVVRAFFRPPPREQAGFSDLVGAVVAEEFAGRRSLVVGGSRGLGEVTAKLLAAGGADVRLTYVRGCDDARRTVQDIRSGGGRAAAFALDVLDPRVGLGRVRAERWVPTDLHYFAAPHIGQGMPGSYSEERYRKFHRYFVSGFARTVDAVLELGPELLRVFYPSSVFVRDRPPDQVEYVAAKEAGEAMCDDLRRGHENLRILAPRLPRLATDQTRSLVGKEGEDPAPVLLRELRRLRDG